MHERENFPSDTLKINHKHNHNIYVTFWFPNHNERMNERKKKTLTLNQLQPLSQLSADSLYPNSQTINPIFEQFVNNIQTSHDYALFLCTRNKFPGIYIPCKTG